MNANRNSNSLLKRAAPALPALLAAAVMLGLGLYRNDFPHQYHNDEPSKVDQIAGEHRNYRHPPLLLDLTELAVGWIAEPSRQTIAMAGRAVSAVAMAAAAALTVAALGRFGQAAAWCGAWLFVSRPAFIESAHYFKEDALLLGGFAFVVWAVSNMKDSNRIWALALAAAVAASAKYFGLAALALAIPALLLNQDTRVRRLTRFALFFVLFWLVLNLRNLLGFSQSVATFSQEWGWMRTGHHGAGTSESMQFYLYFLMRDGGILLLGLSALALALGSRRMPLLRLIALWTLLAVLALSFFPKVSPRYLDPILLMLVVLAAAGAAAIMERLPKRLRYIVAGAAVVYTALPGIERLEGFSTDDRATLAEYVANNLPSDAVIAQDAMVNLEAGAESAGVELPQEIRSSYFVADLAESGGLSGVTHVAGTWHAHHRFVDSGDLTNPRTRFYHALYESHPPELEIEGRDPKPLHPGLRLWRVQE